MKKYDKGLGSGWHQESHCHRLARLGVKTTSDVEKRIRNEELYINRKLFPMETNSKSKYFLPKEELKKKYPRKELLTIVLKKDKAHLLDFLKGYTYLDAKGRWMNLDEDNIQFDIEYLDTADKKRTQQLLKEFRQLNDDKVGEDLFYVRVIPIEASSLNYKRVSVRDLDYAGEAELIKYAPLIISGVQAKQQSQQQQKPVPAKVPLLQKGWVGRGLRAEAEVGKGIVKGAGSLLGTAVQGIFYEPEPEWHYYSPEQMRLYASRGYYPQLRDPDYAKHFMVHNPKEGFYAQDIYAEDMKDARNKAKEMYGLKRLNNRIAVWEKRFD